MKAFIAMPFHKDFDSVWETIKKSCQANDIEATRVDKIFGDDIVKDICNNIQDSDIVIADFTGDKNREVSNPNVVTEATKAKEMGKEVIILTQSIAYLPFDWKTQRAIEYENTQNGLEKLDKSLTDRIREIKIESQESAAAKLLKWIIEKAIEGIPLLLSGAESVAEEYVKDKSYKDDDERVDSLIAWECSKNFCTGFLTGLGGLITIPMAIPSAIGASWVIQARMSAAIARIYGHSLQDESVRTFILLTLLGDSAEEIVKRIGISLGTAFAEKAIMAIPGKILIEINKQIGIRLITKAGQTGFVNLMKAVPLLGGVVGGGVDLFMCNRVGSNAKEIFKRTRKNVIYL